MQSSVFGTESLQRAGECPSPALRTYMPLSARDVFPQQLCRAGLAPKPRTHTYLMATLGPWCPARLTMGITHIIICTLALGLPAPEGGAQPPRVRRGPPMSGQVPCLCHLAPISFQQTECSLLWGHSSGLSAYWLGEATPLRSEGL